MASMQRIARFIQQHDCDTVVVKVLENSVVVKSSFYMRLNGEWTFRHDELASVSTMTEAKEILGY